MRSRKTPGSATRDQTAPVPVSASGLNARGITASAAAGRSSMARPNQNLAGTRDSDPPKNRAKSERDLHEQTVVSGADQTAASRRAVTRNSRLEERSGKRQLGPGA